MPSRKTFSTALNQRWTLEWANDAGNVLSRPKEGVIYRPVLWDNEAGVGYPLQAIGGEIAQPYSKKFSESFNVWISAVEGDPIYWTAYKYRTVIARDGRGKILRDANKQPIKEQHRIPDSATLVIPRLGTRAQPWKIEEQETKKGKKKERILVPRLNADQKIDRLDLVRHLADPVIKIERVGEYRIETDGAGKTVAESLAGLQANLPKLGKNWIYQFDVKTIISTTPLTDIHLTSSFKGYNYDFLKKLTKNIVYSIRSEGYTFTRLSDLRKFGVSTAPPRTERNLGKQLRPLPDKEIVLIVKVSRLKLPPKTKPRSRR